MRNLASLALLILTMLTGIALGAARGQVLADGSAVLCSGVAVRVVPAPVGPPARETGHAAFCPDMATALLIALASPPALAPRPEGPARPVDTAIVAAVSALPAVTPPKARAPPTRAKPKRFDAQSHQRTQP